MPHALYSGVISYTQSFRRLKTWSRHWSLNEGIIHTLSAFRLFVLALHYTSSSLPFAPWFVSNQLNAMTTEGNFINSVTNIPSFLVSELIGTIGTPFMEVHLRPLVSFLEVTYGSNFCFCSDSAPPFSHTVISLHLYGNLIFGKHNNTTVKLRNAMLPQQCLLYRVLLRSLRNAGSAKLFFAPLLSLLSISLYTSTI